MILLDTHVLVWCLNSPEELSARVRQRIKKAQKEGEELIVSVISVVEICMLVQKGRLEFTTGVEQWLADVEGMLRLRFVAIDTRIALTAMLRLKTLLKDPADRLIMATAMETGAELLTKDKKIRACEQVQVVW